MLLNQDFDLVLLKNLWFKVLNNGAESAKPIRKEKENSQRGKVPLDEEKPLKLRIRLRRIDIDLIKVIINLVRSDGG
ncbi:MAG: hypothetical protein ABIK93_07515 [candidate division WOR-3 bacterium]